VLSGDRTEEKHIMKEGKKERKKEKQEL